ncbi:MAG: lasso peptide biosynthesis B2 protein [Nocardioidaceae bacterium]|nr:lasso peptide biosynthesis B2 protein [Nocardioidaceae bacterium]MCL2614521.1 lasso peptide biosynthesis B2 protein [Nocardioidaceae bacterium]
METVRRRLRVLEALTLVALARLLRRRVPMRRWSFLLGATGPALAGTSGELPPVGVEARVARAVGSAARRTGANCLEQAVAASLMLRVRRRPGAVVIGLDRTDPAGVPHAWLVGGSGAVLTGGETMGDFRAVSQFG